MEKFIVGKIVMSRTVGYSSNLSNYSTIKLLRYTVIVSRYTLV